VPRGFKRNNIATAERKFRCKYSFLSLDGHELLDGADWLDRKWEVWQRDKGKCQLRISPRCNPFPGRCGDPHHKENGVGKRCDCMHNVTLSCRACHDCFHEEVQGRKVRWSKNEEASA
jgi:hypothetical protein